MEKKSWKGLEGKFSERQNQLSDVKCACGCGGFISNRAKEAKEKGLTEGFIKGHTWKGKNMPESAREKMSLNHADVSGTNNPNYGKGLFGCFNPNWQGGKTTQHYIGGNQIGSYTQKDREFRGYIKQLDGNCVLCCNTTRLEVHHIEPWVEAPELRFEEQNCVTLCKPCHVKADNVSHKDTNKAMLKAYVIERSKR